MKLTRETRGISIRLMCELENDIPVRGNVMASGDDKIDREQEEWINAQLRRGNDWAWCSAHVRVTYRDILTADDYLGGCSYASEADFRSGGYFDDMVDSCLTELSNQLAALVAP